MSDRVQIQEDDCLRTLFLYCIFMLLLLLLLLLLLVLVVVVLLLLLLQFHFLSLNPFFYPYTLCYYVLITLNTINSCVFR